MSEEAADKSAQQAEEKSQEQTLTSAPAATSVNPATPATSVNPATPATSANPATPATSAKAAAEPAIGPDTIKLSSDDIIRRRSRWDSSLAALRYVSSVARDADVKTRDSDKATSVALLITCIVALISIAVPFLAPWRLGLVGAADALVGMGLLTYVANRFGILTTFTPRQAILTWQLMLGASLLGIFLAMNLGLLIAWQMYNTHIEIPGS